MITVMVNNFLLNSIYMLDSTLKVETPPMSMA
jgi:hypothetical protein